MIDYNNSIAPKISVIVPVYNVESYIARCLNSILNQTYKHLEIILVNDGSTDKSEEICNSFLEKDARIKIFNIENSGSSIARNIGLDNATGEFIGFVDSDDWIQKDMFSIMINYAMENSLKVVECNSINSTELKKEKIVKIFNKIEDREVALERILKLKRFAVWRRLYHSSTLKNKFFIPNILHQDVYYTIDIINEIDKIGYLSNPFYIYNVENMDSVIRGKYSLKKLKSMDAGTYVVENTKQYNFKIKKLAKQYLIKFLKDHYNSLFIYNNLDKDFFYRKKIRQLIIKHQTLENFSFYGYTVKLLPFKFYALFQKINLKRIDVQIKLHKIINNVKS